MAGGQLAVSLIFRSRESFVGPEASCPDMSRLVSFKTLQAIIGVSS